MRKNYSIIDGHSGCFQAVSYVMISNYLIKILGYLFIYTGVCFSFYMLASSEWDCCGKGLQFFKIY